MKEWFEKIGDTVVEQPVEVLKYAGLVIGGLIVIGIVVKVIKWIFKK